MQSFARLGREFRVNPNATGTQSDPSVVANAYGGYQIFWTDSTADSSVTGIKAQVFTATGSRFAADFGVNAVTAQGQYDPASLLTTGGGWNVVVWTDASGVGDTSGTGIKAQFMDGVGGKYQSEYRINTTTAGNQSDASMAALGLNNYVVVWTDESGGVPAIRAQLMNSTAKTGAELLVSAAGGPAATDAVVAPLSSGGFVVVWRSGDSSGSAVRAQVYATNGAKVGGELILASGAADSIANPAVVALSGGRFVVAWTGTDAAGDPGIAARIFDSAGGPLGNEIAASGGVAGPQTHPTIATTAGGGFLIGWTDGVTGARDVEAQLFGTDGAPIGGALLVSEVADGDQWGLAMATLTGGDTVLSWSETDLLGDTNVKSQVFRFPTSAPTEGGVGDDNLVGTTGNDFIDGAAGNDTIRGAAGNDVLLGGDGNDSLYGEAGNDSLEGGSGNDWLEDRTQGVDHLSGGEGNDNLFVVRGNSPTFRDRVTMYGGDGDDLIHFEGLGTDLTIEAGDGADTIELSVVEDVNATISLGAGQDRIVFLPPKTTPFRTPVVLISDFTTGAGGDIADFSRLVKPDALFTGELRFRQVGSDAVIFVLDGDGRISSYATFQNRLVSDFTSDNIVGVSLPSTLTVTGDASNGQFLVGDPAILITGTGATFTNVAGGKVKGNNPAADALGAIKIQASGVTVDNKEGGTISKADGGTVALTGSDFGDRILNGGVIDGSVGLGAGNDYFFEKVTASNNGTSQTPLDMGQGDDEVAFEMSGGTTLNLSGIVGGDGFDTLRITNIAHVPGNVSIRGAASVEALHLSAAEGGGIANFASNPGIADIYLGPGLTLEIADSVFSRSAYIGPAVGRIHLEGGGLRVGPNAAFAQIIGSDAAEKVELTSRIFPPAAPPTAHGSVSMGGGDDYFIWNTPNTSPGSADGGSGSDRLRVGQDIPVQSLAAFTSFETVNYFLSNGYSGLTYRLTDIGSDVETLLIDTFAYTATIELNGIAGTGLDIGAGAARTVILAGNILASLSDRYLIDSSQTAVSQNIENRGTITGDVDLGSDHDLLINEGMIGGDVDLGQGNDLFTGRAGGSVAGTVRGGAGDDLYTIDSVHAIEENADEGQDEVRTALASYVLGANVENLSAGSDSAHDFRGNSANNIITGGAGSDFLRFQDGGDDIAFGGAGNDVFLFGGALTSADQVDGGSGTDQIAIQGDYAGTEALTLGSNLVGIENLAILPGNDIRFGDPGTNFYDYHLILLDVAVAAGVQLVVDANRLREGEDFTFDGSAESDGSFFIYGGTGVDILTGGAKNDVFLFGAWEQWGASDVIVGGAGLDQLALRGNYTLTFGAGQLIGIENIGLLSAHDTRFGALGSSYSYDLTMVDENVAAGVQMIVDGAKLRIAEFFRFDGSAELDGSFRVFGGLVDDIIIGTRNDDFIQGNGGADSLTGGAGADIFRYLAASDSTASATDRILDFTPGTDRIDLSRIDADTAAAGDQAFSWIGSNAFSGSAGELRAFQQGGDWLLEGDTDGDGSADFFVLLTLEGPTPLSAVDFAL